MDKVKAYEKEKYAWLWSQKDYTSSSAINYANSLRDKVKGKVLEIGSGKGISLDILSKEEGIECVGVDITLVGNEALVPVYEYPAWDLPFESNSFDFSFSTDVLEHIPTELIEATLIDIGRVTRVKTFHNIATKEAVTKYKGEQVHLTLKSREWWEETFEKYCKCERELSYW